MERAIAAVPLPYALVCLLVACLTQSPGFLLANLLDGASADAAVRAAFPGLATTPALVVAAESAYGVGFYAGLLLMIRYARRQLVARQGAIVPLLPDGEAGFRRIYGIVNAPAPVLGIAAVLSALFWSIGTHSAEPGPAVLVFPALQVAVVALTTATVLWTFVVTLWGLRRLGKEALILRPYTEDPMLGLRPLGSISVSASTLYFAMVTVVVVAALVQPQAPAYLAFLLALLGIGVLLFVLPLLGIHRLMAAEKRKAEAQLAAEAARQWEAMRRPLPDGADGPRELQGLVLSLRDFVAHERAERRVASLPTWPFDPQVTGRIAAIVLTGVVAVLGRAAVDWFLAR